VKSSLSTDQQTISRIRDVLAERSDVLEKRMFGSICFMVGGRMCCGVANSTVFVRVGKDGFEKAVAQPHARPMDFTGRPSTSTVYVDPLGYRTRAALAKWVNLGVALATTEAPQKRRR
jgi:TfoX/Sxy family transcriptional regulator of competence genes